MSNSNRPQAPPSEEITAPASPAEIRARIALTGNLAGLTDPERWAYYQEYCAYLGLDPITRPFDLLTRYETGPNGQRIEKVELYANQSCAAQLAEKRHITYTRPELLYDSTLGIASIVVMARYAWDEGKGREVWRRGVAHVEGLKGKALENAIKKAETQAHRRATLALCGVSMPDESEVEDIPGALPAPGPSVTAPMDDYEYIGELIKSAGMEDSDVERRYVYGWLTQGAFQAMGARLNQAPDYLARRFGHLAKTPALVAPEAGEIPTIEKAEAIEAEATERPEAPAPNPATLPEGAPVFHKAEATQAPADDGKAEQNRQAREKNHPSKPAPPNAWGPKNRAHSDAAAARLDVVVQRLTVHKVPAQDLLREANAWLKENNRPEVTTRYALNTPEAEEIAEFFEKWAARCDAEKAKEKPA